MRFTCPPTQLNAHANIYLSLQIISGVHRALRPHRKTLLGIFAPEANKILVLCFLICKKEILHISNQLHAGGGGG